MAIRISEKNFLEKVAALIPGLAGYREREARRETDRRVREYLAGRLDEARSSLDVVRRAIMDSGELKLLNEAARIDKALQKSASSLRYADYGYAGLFDQLKIREEELDQIHAFDTGLVGDVEALAARLAQAAVAVPDVLGLTRLASGAEELDAKVVRRKDLFEVPGA